MFLSSGRSNPRESLNQSIWQEQKSLGSIPSAKGQICGLVQKMFLFVSTVVINTAAKVTEGAKGLVWLMVCSTSSKEVRTGA